MYVARRAPIARRIVGFWVGSLRVAGLIVAWRFSFAFGMGGRVFNCFDFVLLILLRWFRMIFIKFLRYF